MSIPTPAYEYFLTFWGEVENEKWIERDLGIYEKEFWFQKKSERESLKARLNNVADAHNVTIVFDESEGRSVRLRTVARMTMVLPDGRAFPVEYDFGYAYPPKSAEFMFQEGNYSCDCNRSIFLAQAGHDVGEMNCGDRIKLTDFRVETDAP